MAERDDDYGAENSDDQPDDDVVCLTSCLKFNLGCLG